MRNHLPIKFVQKTTVADGAAGTTAGPDAVLYECMADVRPNAIRRTVDALASEISYGATFEVFLPPTLTIGTDTPVYVGEKLHAVLSVQESRYPPKRHTVITARRDE